jgi:hypothetical protein
MKEFKSDTGKDVIEVDADLMAKAGCFLQSMGDQGYGPAVIATFLIMCLSLLFKAAWEGIEDCTVDSFAGQISENFKMTAGGIEVVRHEGTMQ